MGLLGQARRVQVLSDGDVVEIGAEVRWHGTDGHRRPPPQAVDAPWALSDVQLGGFDDFMEKEIAEQAELSTRLIERHLPRVNGGRLWHDLGLPVPARVRGRRG